MIKETNKNECLLCQESDLVHVSHIDKKPPKETDYGISNLDYKRDIYKCNSCGVFINRHDNLIPQDFYEGQYNSSIGEGNLIKRFNRIINIEFKNSDNKNRVSRIINFLYSNDILKKNMKALDIGSGTSVFSHELLKFGFETTCVDPDPNSIKHALENVKVEEGFVGFVENFQIEKQFDFISFNKVLEHTNDPVKILKDVNRLLSRNGIIYVEMPDSTLIESNHNYFERSEFFIDHNTVYNESSMSQLAKCGNLNILHLDRCIDPSGKHTIYMFLN